MEGYINDNEQVVLDGEIVPGAYAAREKHLEPRIVYYVRNQDKKSYQIAMLSANEYEVWSTAFEPIGPYGEYILRFGGLAASVRDDEEFIDAFAEALNFCVWADSHV